mgnify:CR=1 FL=1|tara:strand:- start:1945 stop:8316 length:6372 start_codon:yes stop_codon:yes gene_type:complete
MLSTALSVTFNVNDLSSNYEVVGSSDNYSFQYNLGRGSKLVDFAGDSAQKTISLKGNYGEFSIRVFAVSDIGVRSAFIEEKITISPPFFDDTFTFADISISNLPEEPNIGKTIQIDPSTGQNLLAVDSEYISRDIEIDWRLAPPLGHAKEGQSLGSELLSDSLFKEFSLQIRNTQDGNIVSSSSLNNSRGLQGYLNTASVSDYMSHYTGFNFLISNTTLTELNLDRTLSLEVVCEDVFDRTCTGVITGINYLPTVNGLSYNLRGAEMSFSWSHNDTDFSDVVINSLNIPSSEEIYNPYDLQDSINYYGDMSNAANWSKHNNYRQGDKVLYKDIVYHCVDSYSFSDDPDRTPLDQLFWSGCGEVVPYGVSEDIVANNNFSKSQIWGNNYFYSFQPRDTYGTGRLFNLTSSGLGVDSLLGGFRSDVKIDNLSFIERDSDLIFKWNVTDQDNNLVDLNQYKFMLSRNDQPTILGISGSLFDSDTNLTLTGITEGLGSRSSRTEGGVQTIVEDLPGTKVFETFEYTRALNNSLYKDGGFPDIEDFSESGSYSVGDSAIINKDSVFTSLISPSDRPSPLPSYQSWEPSLNLVFRTGGPYVNSVFYSSGIYHITGSADGEIVGPDSQDVLGVFNEFADYAVGDLVVSPAGDIDLYETGSVFLVGDYSMFSGTIYRSSREQSSGESIFPNTGINHWYPISPFSDVGCHVYKSKATVSADSRILPNSGHLHWQVQDPDSSDKYSLCATYYDFDIQNWVTDENFTNGDFVVYKNDIWSGAADSGPDLGGAKEPSSANSSYWKNGLTAGHDFSTNHLVGDKVFSNGTVYKCLANNPTGAPIEAFSNSPESIMSTYQDSQWAPYWEFNTGFEDVVFKHIGIPQSGKRKVGLELGILSPEGDILNSRTIIGNNPEPSIIPQGFQVDSLSNTTKVKFSFNYAFASREKTTKVQVYRSSDHDFSILGSDGLPGSGAESFVSEILGPGDATFGENLTSITDSPPIPNIPGLGDQVTGYYYKLLPYDAFGSGDLFSVIDNQGDLERVLVYPLNYNNQNPNGFAGPVFSSTKDEIPGPVENLRGETAFQSYFLNWEMPGTSVGYQGLIPNDLSHYEVWESEEDYLYFGSLNKKLTEEDNSKGFRRITGDVKSTGPIPIELQDPASGITNATNLFNISANSPSCQAIHSGETNDKRFFWARAVDTAGNKGPFTGASSLASQDIIGLEMILGQAKTTDLEDFEQNITNAFPNNLSLVPNNPFLNNHPSVGKISWERHFLYHHGNGYVIGPGTADVGDQYVYWSATGRIPTHSQDITSLTYAQSGELGLGVRGGGRLDSTITNPLRNIQYSGGYDISTYHPGGEGNKGQNNDSEKPSLLGESGDYLIARNAAGTATPMWHAFANALIGTAHIQEAAITNAKIHNLTADKIRSAEIFGQDIQVGGNNSSGQIRSAGFEGLHSLDGAGYNQQGFAISGDGTFTFQTKQGKLYFQDDELTIEGNIRQKDGSELTVMSMTAEPGYFFYEENANGEFVPEINQISDIVVRYNNSSISAGDVRFKMTDPDGVEIFGYDDYSNGYNISGFTYDPSLPAHFDASSRIATATFNCGNNQNAPNPIVGFDTVIHGSDNVADFQSVVIYASGVGTSTEHSTTIGMLSQGSTGPTGRSPVYRGNWVSTKNYLGINDGTNSADSLRGDLVYNTVDSSYYIAIHDNVGKRPDLNPTEWKTFGAQFESVATRLLLAEDAVITHSLTMGASDLNNPNADTNGRIITSDWSTHPKGSPEGFLGGSYSDPGYALSVDSSDVLFEVGGPGPNYSASNTGDISYIRYSSSAQKIEIVGTFINNTSAEQIDISDIDSTDSQATFIGAGYNNKIHPDPNGQYNSLGSSILAGAENEITGRFSFIGNGFGNKVGDNFSAIVAGFENTMPDVDINSAGANIIGAGKYNSIDGGSNQSVLGGENNNIEYSPDVSLNLGLQGYHNVIMNPDTSFLSPRVMGDGVNYVVVSPTNPHWYTTWMGAMFVSPINGITPGRGDIWSKQWIAIASPFSSSGYAALWYAYLSPNIYPPDNSAWFYLGGSHSHFAGWMWSRIDMWGVIDPDFHSSNKITYIWASRLNSFLCVDNSNGRYRVGAHPTSSDPLVPLLIQ